MNRELKSKIKNGHNNITIVVDGKITCNIECLNGIVVSDSRDSEGSIVGMELCMFMDVWTSKNFWMYEIFINGEKWNTLKTNETIIPVLEEKKIGKEKSKKNIDENDRHHRDIFFNITVDNDYVYLFSDSSVGEENKVEFSRELITGNFHYTRDIPTELFGSVYMEILQQCVGGETIYIVALNGLIDVSIPVAKIEEKEENQ